MNQISNEVLAIQIKNVENNVGNDLKVIRDIIEKFELKFDTHVKEDGKRLTDLEKYKFMFLGAIILMNAVFLPLLIWKITK